MTGNRLNDNKITGLNRCSEITKGERQTCSQKKEFAGKAQMPEVLRKALTTRYVLFLSSN